MTHEITKLEVRLKDKTLSLNGKDFKLEDSLFSAELSQVVNSEEETSLELKYRRKGEDFLSEEAERMYLFLDEGKSADTIQVNFYPETDFPTIALVGRYVGTVRN